MYANSFVKMLTIWQGSSVHVEISRVGREKVALSEMGGTVHNNIVQTLQGKGSKGKVEWCFRCGTKGHVTAECTTTLFRDICQPSDHVPASCLVKKCHTRI